MDPHHEYRLRLRLIDQILHLPAERLGPVDSFLSAMDARKPLAEAQSDQPTRQPDWPHAPLHRLSDQGTYIVTAATYQKEHFFRGPERLTALESALHRLTDEAGWRLEAWAVFSNHYHFLAHTSPGSRSLDVLIKQLHGSTARWVNQMDEAQGRTVWFNYWDTQLTIETSYLARLNYVHHNPVKHGLVRVASDYRWCSAAWFERTATPAQVQTVYSFKTDRVNVIDDFDPV
jgi:putative transposase